MQHNDLAPERGTAPKQQKIGPHIATQTPIAPTLTRREPGLSQVDTRPKTPIDTPDNIGTTTVSATPPLTALIPQPHGGALRPGGKLGNRGGKGRPAKEVQSRSRRLYDMVLTRLARKLNDEDNSLDVSELVAAGNMAGKHSGLAAETVRVEVALLPIEERKARIAQIVARAAARVQGPPRVVTGWHGEYVTTEVEGLAEDPFTVTEMNNAHRGVSEGQGDVSRDGATG